MSDTTINDTDSEDLVVKLGKLEETIGGLRDKRNEYNQITKESLSKRNELNQEIHELLEKAKDCMAKRDQLNESVKELKAKRKNLQESLQKDKKTLDEIVEQEQTINQEDIKKKRRVMRGLNSQIDKLEWELQTSVLSPERENEMIQHLERLSDRLNKIASEVHITTQQTNLWKKIASAQNQINKLHVQIVDAAKESQIFHNLMNQHFHQVNLLRKKANDNHKEFLKSKKTADKYHKEFLAKVTEKNELRTKLKEIQQQHRKQIKERIRTSIEENVNKAFEKYENGENLTLEEFRLLVENGMI